MPLQSVRAKKQIAFFRRMFADFFGVSQNINDFDRSDAKIAMFQRNALDLVEVQFTVRLLFLIASSKSC